VSQQLGDGLVRCIAIENIFGIRRGLEVIDTGSPIQVPVGRKVLGRIFNVLGDTIDNKEQIEDCVRWSIFRDPPPLVEQKIAYEIQETGINSYRSHMPFFKRI
jgi:F-type H+-transporting ATPase subunit beta